MIEMFRARTDVFLRQYRSIGPRTFSFYLFVTSQTIHRRFIPSAEKFFPPSGKGKGKVVNHARCAQEYARKMMEIVEPGHETSEFSFGKRQLAVANSRTL